MVAGSLEPRIAEALETFVSEMKTDRTVLAAILGGSLSHDRVWEKSDIDVVLVIRDGDMVERNGYAFDVRGVNLHACLMPRAECRRTVGTVTDIAGYLNLLFTTIAQPRCPRTDEPVPSRAALLVGDGLMQIGVGKDAGPTVLLVEHHMDVIKTADHIIDLGPEGGHESGEAVIAGTLEEVARCRDSHTGAHLRRHPDSSPGDGAYSARRGS